MKQKFYECKHCHNIVAVVKGEGKCLTCCNEKMKEIIPGTIDASHEKHVPVYNVENNIVTVNIGAIAHPMLAEHYIEWVSLQTKFGNQRKELKPGQEPKVSFAILNGDEVEAVYAFCNLHGLWKSN